MLRRGIIVWIMLIVATLAVCSCTTFAENKVRIMRVHPYGDSMDPGLWVTLAPDLTNAGCLWEGLFELDKNHKPVPAICESYTVSKDGLTYTFKLNPKKRFSNGEPITAEDVRACWLRLADPDVGANCIEIFDEVKGFYEAKSRRVPLDDVGIKVIDKYTLQVQLVRPSPSFIASLTIMGGKVVTSAKNLKAHPTDFWKPQYFVGSGPYMLTEHVPNEKFVMKKNPYYYDPNNEVGNVDTFEVLIAGQPLPAYLNGEVDIAWSLGANDVLSARKNPRIASHLKFYPTTEASAIWMNRSPEGLGPLSDVRVRRALFMAIDRKTIVDTLSHGTAKALYSYVTGGLGDLHVITSEDDPQIKELGLMGKYDPEGAKKLLAEAGYPGGKGFPTIYTYAGAGDLRIQAIVENWKKVLGINCVIVPCPDWPALSDHLFYFRDDNKPGYSFFAATCRYPETIKQLRDWYIPDLRLFVPPSVIKTANELEEYINVTLRKRSAQEGDKESDWKEVWDRLAKVVDQRKALIAKETNQYLKNIYSSPPIPPVKPIKDTIDEYYALWKKEKDPKEKRGLWLNAIASVVNEETTILINSNLSETGKKFLEYREKIDRTVDEKQARALYREFSRFAASEAYRLPFSLMLNAALVSPKLEVPAGTYNLGRWPIFKWVKVK